MAGLTWLQLIKALCTYVYVVLISHIDKMNHQTKQIWHALLIYYSNARNFVYYGIGNSIMQ